MTPNARIRFRQVVAQLQLGEGVVYFEGWTNDMTSDEAIIFREARQQADDGRLFLSQKRLPKAGTTKRAPQGFAYSATKISPATKRRLGLLTSTPMRKAA